MLVESPNNSTQKLVLMDTIQRLEVEYHFKNDIETSIQNIFKESQQSKNDDDLYVVALRFRLVRQQRHYICDISAMESVSPNLRRIYKVLIEFLNEIEDELKKEGKADRVYYAKVEVIKLA
ncbi:hypothetical protein R3W88_025906 [Solanum pinnatisectum]|uniref:Uncharacterized protein n=1 Tax=Solanum pinnatisectum TaxID=50273 RepID=A0AAV9M5E0_9SOLN|nr:hypothetical protein R3W88_025906 [Solanum pinnatisectum]